MKRYRVVVVSDYYLMVDDKSRCLKIAATVQLIIDLQSVLYLRRAMLNVACTRCHA